MQLQPVQCIPHCYIDDSIQIAADVINAKDMEKLLLLEARHLDGLA